MGACTLNAYACVCTCVKRKIRTRLDLLSIPSFVVSTFKSVCVYTRTCVLMLSSTILGAGDDLLSSAAGKLRYVQLKRLR